MAELTLITAVQCDIKVYKGDTTGPIITVTKNGDGTPWDLSAAEIKMEIRPAAGQDPVDTFSTEGDTPDITVSGEDHNIITIKGWERLPAGANQYDLQITDGADVITVLYGKITVTTDITA